MPVIIKSPTHSFLRFGESGSFIHPIYGEVTYCLPVYNDNDNYFQFVLEGSDADQTDQLLDLNNDIVVVGIANECGDPYLIEFTEKPERFRISDRQILYNWKHGLPNFQTEIGIDECFILRIEVQLYGVTYSFCSNCLQRINDEDFTSVIEYGNDENSFGFNYCEGDPVDPDSDVTCEPTIITFNNIPTLTLPYTASLQAMYGDAPSIQTWIYDSNGDLVNNGIVATLDNVPPTLISWDFGGNASGIVRIGP